MPKEKLAEGSGSRELKIIHCSIHLNITTKTQVWDSKILYSMH